ncbi:MAG: PKD domain-containing protein [Deltaproteobacteria bacterium]
MLRNISLVALLSGVAAAGPRLSPVHNTDGSIQVGNHNYASQQAYFASQEWKESGGRCGTETPAAISLMAPLVQGYPDCSDSATMINPAYADGRTFVIQVVFHLIEKTDGTGHISDDQVNSQIQILNEDYGALANSHGAPGNNASIKFVLARFDPSGNPTNGIERVTNNSYFAEGDPGPSPMKAALTWDSSRYLNVYSSGLDTSGLLGYATFPWDRTLMPGNDKQDGVVLAYQSVGNNAAYAPYDLGASATHEIGHWFGLYHTFQGPITSNADGCTGSSNAYQQGDLLSDTVKEKAPAQDCTAHASGCVAGQMAPIENYMDYSYDSCMVKFTVEQVDRVRCGAVHYRWIDTEPKSLFTYNANMLAVTFASASTDAESTAAQLHYNWDFGDGMTSTDQNPMHTYAAAGSYNVKLEVVDPGSAANTSTQAIVVSGTGMGSGSGSGNGSGSGSDGSGNNGGGDAGTTGGNETGGMNGGGCCQAPKGGVSFLLCGFPVAFVLGRRRRRR